MKTLTAILCMAASLAFGEDKQAFEPVDAWPSQVTIGKVTYYNPPASICVKAGKRLKTAMPGTPTGKQVKSVTWEQSTNDASRCVAVCVYEDIVIVPVYEETLVKVGYTNVQFWFNTSGAWRSCERIDAPKTNKVEK